MTKEVLTSALPAVKGIVAVLRWQETFWSKNIKVCKLVVKMPQIRWAIFRIRLIILRYIRDISDTGIKKKLGLNKNDLQEIY